MFSYVWYASISRWALVFNWLIDELTNWLIDELTNWRVDELTNWLISYPEANFLRSGVKETNKKYILIYILVSCYISYYLVIYLDILTYIFIYILIYISWFEGGNHLHGFTHNYQKAITGPVSILMHQLNSFSLWEGIWR